MSPLVWWLLAGCGDDAGTPESSGASAVEFAGPVGRLIELIPLGDPKGGSTALDVLDGAWDLHGADGQNQSYETHLSEADGLRVDDQLLLPPRLAAGTTAEGTTVTAVGSFETWYGTFPDTVSVEVPAGDFAGVVVFARDVGPVALVWQGWAGELAYYE